MIHVKKSVKYYINERALTFSENDLDDPQRVAVSLVSGTVIMVRVPGVIDYASDGNFERWTLKGYSTKLVNNAFHYVYARLSRTDRTALVVFSVKDYNIDGSITTAGEGEGVVATAEPSTDYFYIKIGELTSTDGKSDRELTYDSGLLGTEQGKEELSPLNEMWELSKLSTPWLIRAKHWLSGFTVKGFISLVGGFVFKSGEQEKPVTDIKRSTDSDEDVPVGDENLATSAWTAEYVENEMEKLDERFLSKIKDDETPYSLGVGKNLTVGGDTSIGGGISVESDAVVNGGMAVGKDVSVGGGISVGSDAVVDGGMTVGESASVGGSLSVDGDISAGGDIVSKGYAEGTVKGGYAIHKNEDGEYEAEADNVIARILARTYDLLVQNHATFVGGLSSEEFISGFLSGKGWSIRMKEFTNAAGAVEKKSVAEFDDLIVRGSMRIYEFIVSQMLGENDNRIFTGMMEVDHYDAMDGKIYLKTDGGKLYNPFRVDDVIIVQQYGGNPSEENGYYVTKQYEFIVTEVGVGEQGEDRLDWVRFRNFTTSMEGGSESLITERDTLVRLDNLSNADRKGIIQLMSVGQDTPYMDFIYGAKTDPDNSLKGRLGNLGGVYNPLFGWLQEFGAYLTNLYAVGEFVIAHTGENVADSIEIAKGQFRTNFRQSTYDMSEEQNFLTNASMTNNCEHWTLGADDTEYFLVDGLPQSFNFDLLASEQTYAGLSEWKGRDMLRLNKSSITQWNSLIRKAGTHKVHTGYTENPDGSYTDTYEEVPDKLYLSVRFYVALSGKVEFGFVGSDGKFIDNDFHYSSDVTAREDGYEVKLSGIWDGTGDFSLISTGDVYVDMLSLTDKPLDNFKITTETKIEQDAARISLLGKKINGVEGSVTDLGIELNAAEERIRLYVNQEVDGVSDSVSDLEVRVNGISSTVAQVQSTASDAKSLAGAAQSAADDAAAKAKAAQNTADSASSKAAANATAISQQADSISLLAGAFTLQNGKYVLTSAAGAVITSEVASLYATKTTVDSLGKRVTTAESSITTMSGQIELKASQSSVDSLGKRVTTAESSITTMAGQIELKASQSSVDSLGKRMTTAESNITATSDNISVLTGKIKFDSNGNITNIDKSGLMVESDFASMFTTQVTAQGVAKTAEIKSYVDSEISGIKITADKIDISSNEFIGIINKGTTTISASRVDLSGLVTVTTLNSTLSGYATDSELSAAQTALNKSISDLNTTLSTQINAKASTESLNQKVNELNTAISGKADSSNLKALAYEDVVEAALCGNTLISGGYLNTDYCKVKTIEAIQGTVGGFTIHNDKLTVTTSLENQGFIAPSYLLEMTGQGINVTAGENNEIESRFGVSFFSDVDTNYFTTVNVRNNQLDDQRRSDNVCVVRASLIDDDYGLFIEGGSTHILSSGITRLNGLVLNVRTVTSSSTLQKNDDVVVFNNTSTITVNLPNDVPVGKIYYLKQVSDYVVNLSGLIRREKSVLYDNETLNLAGHSWIAVHTDVAWSLFYCAY